MHKIDKSFFPTEEHEDAFQRLCNSHIQELRAHDKRLKMVEETKNLPDDDPEKWVDCPAPVAHPDVAAAVVKDGKDYNISYQIVDGRSLDEKKQSLLSEVVSKASELQEKIYPMQKRNLLSMKCQMAMKSQSKTKEEEGDLSMHEKINEKSQQVNFHLAKLQSEIYDLDEKNINEWKPAPFPEVAQ